MTEIESLAEDPPPPLGGEPAPSPARDVPASGENERVPLTRITWAVTTAAFLVAGAVLLVEAYYGYAVVTFVVAASAAVNLL